jgi:hypothetical protein
MTVYSCGAAVVSPLAMMLAISCGGTTTSIAATCVPNAQQSCVCDTGGSGFQTCNSAGASFSACACVEAAVSDGGGDGPSDGASDGPGDAAGTGPSCVPNAQQSCVCPAGGPGVQTCNSAGTRFSVCSCFVGADEGGSAAPTEAGSEGGGDGSSGVSGCEVSGTFLMNQPCGGEPNVATLQLALSGSEVVVLRTPVSNAMDSCTYMGTMSADCTVVVGTFVCTGAGGGSGNWSATVLGKCASGSGCGLGTSWTEDEAYTGTAGCAATWTQQ